ncbi:MAG: hypothetical protein IPM74_16835 [Crocinitomicaceae bacterium]|nr:hypothetical protein [Crocinitomicaceae bacterium]
MKKFATLLFYVALPHGILHKTPNKVKTAEPIVDFAEVEPQYPGGDSAMVNFIRDNVTYPENQENSASREPYTYSLLLTQMAQSVR